jgi:hypothetical protein
LIFKQLRDHVESIPGFYRRQTDVFDAMGRSHPFRAPSDFERGTAGTDGGNPKFQKIDFENRL